VKNDLIKRFISSVIILPSIIFIIFVGGIFFNVFFTICFFLTFYEWRRMSKTSNYYLPGVIFLLISFFSIFLTVIESYENNSLGNIYLILLICVASDLGGYSFGKIIRGPKLTKISPNKTYAGVFGSYIFAVIFSVIYLIYFEKLEIGLLNFEFDIKLFILIIVLSTISQLGDISISFFKRLSKIKDTGNLIPGHGGILDRIDGIIFVFPSYYFINLFFL
jgi:phosphatidate cytidylyltransferase